MFRLEEEINNWKVYLAKRESLGPEDICELEDHLRSQIEDLINSGLDEEEAYLVAIKRIGALDKISGEFEKYRIRQYWKQLIADKTSTGKIMLLSALVCASWIISRIFVLIEGPGQNLEFSYLINICFIIFPSIYAYYFFTAKPGITKLIIPAGAFFAGFVFLKFLPFKQASDTLNMAAAHLPLLLWVCAGYIIQGKEWSNAEGKINHFRLSGEVFIYGVLIGLGFGVLYGTTSLILDPADIKLSNILLNEFIIPLAIFGTPVLAAGLASLKKSVIDNFAPLLAKIFAPLFICVLLIFIGAVIIQGKKLLVNREFLISYDAVMILVTAMVIFIISSRGAPGRLIFTDYAALALMGTAIISDIIALSAVISRLISYGMSVNKVTMLGVNILLLANLAFLIYAYIAVLLKKKSERYLDTVQAVFVYIYSGWFALVIFIFPFVFNFK